MADRPFVRDGLAAGLNTQIYKSACDFFGFSKFSKFLAFLALIEDLDAKMR